MQKLYKAKSSLFLVSQRRFSFLDRSMAQGTDDTLPMFIVNRKTGFLPRKEPLCDLPNRFEVVDRLLKAMEIEQPNGGKGLLWSGDFGKSVDTELPYIDMTDVKDPALVAALFRDYTFLASAYLLEPCDIN